MLQRLQMWLTYLCVCVIVFTEAQSETCLERCALTDFVNLCSSAQVITEIEGMSRAFDCPESSSITHRERPNQEAEPINNTTDSRYLYTGSTFRISDLQTTDEYLYRCNDPGNTEFCLLVVDSAVFQSCEQQLDTEGLVCEETVEVTVGEDAVFNTRLAFNGGNICGCQQDFSQFSFTSDNVSIPASFSCQSPCVDFNGNLNRSLQSNTPFDFDLVLPSVPVEYNGSTFTLSAFGSRPDGSTDRFTKTFSLNVLPAPTSTPPGSGTGLTTSATLGVVITGIFMALMIVDITL